MPYLVIFLKKFKYIFVSYLVVLLPLLFSFVLTGCSLLPGGKEQSVITIRYWGLWEDANTVNQVINEYKKIKPNVNIVYEKKSPQQYRESLQSQIESDEGPDLFRFHNTWVPMLKEVLDPVPSDIVSSTDFKKSFYPTVFFDLRNNEKKFVGVPLEIDGLGLYWNEDIFKAAGINTPPSTWSELAQTAIKLTVRDTSGSIRTAGIALGTASNVDHFSDILGLMILQNGGDLKSPTDIVSADALEYYANFAKGPNRVWDETMPSSTFAFAGGNLAMYFGPSWRATEIKLFNPLLKFRVAPVPQLEGGSVAWASYWAEGVSVKSVNKREAWEFIKFLQKDENLVKLYSDASRTPGRILGEPYPKISLASTIESDPFAGAYIKDAPYMRSFPMASRTFDNGLNDQIIKAYEDAVNSVADGASAKAALSTTAKNVESILARFGIQ